MVPKHDTGDKMEQRQADRVGGMVRRERKSRGWTGAQLADAAGVAPGTVVSIENGRSVRPGNLRAVLDALNIDPVVLSAGTPTVDDDVQLVLDVIQKYLEGMSPEDRGAAVRDLIRHVTT
jgi:transcriptional regulator with XRE-family HTH domain